MGGLDENVNVNDLSKLICVSPDSIKSLKGDQHTAGFGWFKRYTLSLKHPLLGQLWPDNGTFNRRGVHKR